MSDELRELRAEVRALRSEVREVKDRGPACKRCKGSGKQPGLHNQCGRCNGSGEERRP